MFYNTSTPRMFLSLDLLWEYRIQHGTNGPLYVTSSYSTWIFCRGVSGFATDFPCGVWCRGLTTCLLHVGLPFGNRILNNSWAVGLTYWIMNLIFLCFDICNYMSWYIRSFFGFTFLNIYFFKYSCTNIFHRRSLYTFFSCSTLHQQYVFLYHFYGIKSTLLNDWVIYIDCLYTEYCRHLSNVISILAFNKCD